MRRVSDWIEGWKTYREEYGEAPFLYNDWVAVSIIAAVLQRKTWLPWDKKIYPNFYIVLIGPAGVRKGEAMTPGNKLLRDMGIKLTAESTTREALIRHLKLTGTDQDAAGFIDEDGIYKTYSALTIYSEEFTTFIGYNNRLLMADLAGWWDCPNTWTYDTKNKGKDVIEGVYVNLIGATTPEIFRRALPEDAVGGGLLSRTICVFEEQKGQIVIFPTEGDPKLREDLFADLFEIYKITGPFSYNNDFKAKYADWYPTQHLHINFDDPKLAAYIQRRSTHLRKLCMVMNAARGGDKILTGEDFDRSLDLLKRTEKNMPKTFAGFGASDKSEVLHNIAQFIYIKKEVYFSDLMKRFMADVGKDELIQCIATLEVSGLIEKISIQDTKGNIMVNNFKVRYKEASK